MVAIAPEFTIGLVRPSPLCSIAPSELNGRPVALTEPPRASSRPIASHTRANTKGFETLMIVNSCSASPTA